MTDLVKSDWRELDSDNTNPSPNGVSGGYAPSTIGPIIRSIRGALKRFYVQSNALYSTTGTGAAYILTYSAAPQGYSAGIIYRFFAHADNTGAVSLNINSLGAKAILSQHGEPLTAGKIKAGKVVEVVYNGTSFELISNEVHDSKFTGTTTLANLAASGNINTANLSVSGNNSISGELSVGPGSASVDGTILANLNIDRPWTIRQRGADGTATLSFENTTEKGIGFSSEATYAGPKIVLTPSATPSITIGGNAVWHAGNDGSGSGLDSDLLDGQHGAYYRDLANSTGTLPNARISGAYDGITTLSQTGLHTITTTGEGLRLSGPAATDDPFISFYAGGARTAYIQHTDGTTDGTGLRLFNDVTDDYLYLSNFNNVDALKFYDSSVATHQTVLTTGNLTSARVTDALGFTPASSAISITAGNGLSGGGTLAATRTITLGTPTSITNSSTNSVTATSHAHALGFMAAEVYTGSTRDNTNFPLGHTVLIGQSSADNYVRNSAVTVYLNASNLAYYNYSGTTALSGTYRARGSGSGGALLLAQRTA